ncbi:caspase family protein [Bradyrhizobium sp. UFLA05-153]
MLMQPSRVHGLVHVLLTFPITAWALLLLATATASAATPASDRGTTCEVAQQSADAPSPKLVVTVDTPAASVRTGDRIAISWKATGLNLGCRTPLYLVLTTPMRTRYEGDKLLALPRGADAPYGIRYRQDLTRVFIPLHIGPGQTQGTLAVKIYENGPLQLDWTLIEVPRLVADPQKRTDFAIGGERTTAVTPLGNGISIVSGNPAVVVRDSFSTEVPTQTFRSNSGEFDLQVFNGYYRVLDARTGELIQERAGWDPNFSPTSRFLGAYAAGPGFEIIDLYAGQVVTANDVLVREHGFSGSINVAAWSAGDTFFALSVQNWGGIELQQSLVDGSQRSFPAIGCHYCPGITQTLHLDGDAGVVAYGGESRGWASLFDRSAGTAAAAAEALKRVPYQPWEDTDDVLSKRRTAIYERRTAVQTQVSLAMIGRLAKSSFFKADDFFKPDADASTGTDGGPIERRWLSPDQMQVSHVCRKNEDRCVGRLADWQAGMKELEEEDARLVKLRVTHKRTSLPVAEHEAFADVRLMAARGSGGGDQGQQQGVSTPDIVWDRLAALLQPAKGPTRWKNSSEGSAVRIVASADDDDVADQPKTGAKLSRPANKGTEDVVTVIARTIPRAERFVREYNDREEEQFWGTKKEAVAVASDMTKEYAQWSVGGRSYVLLRTFFDNGESSRNWLFLIEGSRNAVPHLHDLTHRLRYRVGTRPSGLDEHGKLETTREFATTMGFGGWPESVDRVSIAYDRYLLASGTWTIDDRRWLLMYDLQADKIAFFNRDLPDASTETKFAITADGATILQTNSNGHLYFYNVADEKLVLSGLDIDDELVVYDRHGYYSSTPEGAQFVFVKFPGLSGYNSLHQFSAMLNRPDVIRNILTGKTDLPDPALNAPPEVSLQAQAIDSGNARSAKVKVDVSSPIGLRRLRIFVDGRLAGEYPLSGSSGLIETTVGLLPESRWITTVAVDTAGYESVPQGRDLAGAGAATRSRLFGITVGTDHYDDAGLPSLSVATADARKFRQALMDLKSSLYNAVEVEGFFDAADLRSRLPAKIRDIAAKADEHDTIMLFVAGHGVRDATTSQFLLATRESDLDRARETMISWDEIAASVADAKARVIVFIDACHSGAAGAANDDAVATFLGRKAPVTLIAASKGRQISGEDAAGGIFTTTLIKAIGVARKATDVNGNGAIELAELYGTLKRDVVKASGHQQTPWIARNNMVGETPLF